MCYPLRLLLLLLPLGSLDVAAQAGLEDYAGIDPALRNRLQGAFAALHEPVYTGASWTTDAPFRETEEAIAAARDAGILAEEMEAAALYAFATARRLPVICFAHVTNQMATAEGDFEKGEADGARAALHIVAATARMTTDLWNDTPEGP